MDLAYDKETIAENMTESSKKRTDLRLQKRRSIEKEVKNEKYGEWNRRILEG